MLNEDKSKAISKDAENEDLSLDDLEKISGGAGDSKRGGGILTPEI